MPVVNLFKPLTQSIFVNAMATIFYTEPPNEVAEYMGILMIAAMIQAILACYYFNVPFYSSSYKCWNVCGWLVNLFVIIILHIVIPITVFFVALMLLKKTKDA